MGQVIVNFSMLVGGIVAMFAIDVWGRRVLLLAGGAIMFVSLSVAAILGKMIYDMGDDASMNDTKKTYGLWLLVAVRTEDMESIFGARRTGPQERLAEA